MPPKSRPITVKTLQSLLSRIGSASSGPKAVLQARFLRDLEVSRGFGGGGEKGERGLRIVSVDMGIKNLAVCVARVEFLGRGKGEGEGKNSGRGWDAIMHIERWEKIDLLSAGSNIKSSNMDPENQSTPTPTPTPTPTQQNDPTTEPQDPFSPSSLSHTAYKLTTSTLLPARPDIILIEKQRWRSGGANSVLQWTVRVNTLEAMLWAVLTSVREERARWRRVPVERERNDGKEEEGKEEEEKETTTTDKSFSIWAVDPKRVGQFWLDAQSRQSAASSSSSSPISPPSRTKAEKRAKISLLQTWLLSSPPSTSPSPPISTSPSTSTTSLSTTTPPKISFTIHPPATPTLHALCSPAVKTPRGQQSLRVSETELKKLDDVTDCFLQAAAWVAWEANRRGMVGVWGRRKEGGGEGEELSVDAVREMIGEEEEIN